MKKATAKYRVPEWELVEKIADDVRLILLYGIPGTGKTTSACLLGNLANGFYNVTLTEETPAAELRGHFIPKGNEFVWHDGPAMRAFRNGSRLVLNEIDHASGDCLSFIHALTDDPGVSAITLPTGETVNPHSEFSVWATMNGQPEDLPDALAPNFGRFAYNVEITRPHPGAVATLSKRLQAVISEATSPTDMVRGIGFRAWKAFDHLAEIHGDDVAAKAVFGSRADEILNTLKIRTAGSASATMYSAPVPAGSGTTVPSDARAMLARFAGTCKVCGKHFPKGTTIYYSRSEHSAYCNDCGAK